MTNSAVIASDSSTQTQRRLLAFSGTVPSGCYALQVRLVGTSASADVTWDSVQLRNVNATTLDGPSWLAGPGALIEMQAWGIGASNVGANNYSQDSGDRLPVDWAKVVENPTGATPWRLEFWPSVPAQYMLLASTLRPFAELSADTDTTDADPDWVKAGALAGIYLDMEGPKGLKYMRWAGDLATKDRTFQRLPVRRMHLGPY